MALLSAFFISNYEMCNEQFAFLPGSREYILGLINIGFVLLQVQTSCPNMSPCDVYADNVKYAPSNDHIDRLASDAIQNKAASRRPHARTRSVKFTSTSSDSQNKTSNTTPRLQSRYSGALGRKQNKEISYPEDDANKKLIACLKNQHLVQLIAMLKWSVHLKDEAINGCMKDKQQLSIKRNLMAYGLFIQQNRVYFTKLSADDKNTDCVVNELYVHLLGERLSLNSVIFKDHSPKYQISNGYLDIFDPLHMKVFQTYLRIIIWHEQSCHIKRSN